MFLVFYGECVVKLKQIETPRLIIRPVALGDEYEINMAINNSLESLQKWQVWAQDPSLKTTREFVQAGAFAWYNGIGNQLPMVVIHKQDNKISNSSIEDTDSLLVVLCDLIIDSFIEKRQRTKDIKTRHTKEELKPIFRDSDSRLSKSERA